jgi:hypothetical protein
LAFTRVLASSSTIEVMLLARPRRYTRLAEIRLASWAPSSEVVIASATWGRNMFPYWELDSPYSLFSVKIVLAAGNVTKTMPCTSPAALTIVCSVFEAIWHPGSSGPSGQVR